ATRDRTDRLYRAVRAVARFWLWFFFKAVDVRHPERVPEWGPVLLCINHPNNFIDSLLVGSALGRKVHYLATAALFRNRIVGRFLASCGAIPLYRKEDDPAAGGPPVPVTPYLAAYRADAAKGVEALTTAIQWAMEAEVVHVERIEASDLVRAVEELYRGDLVRELMEARGLAPDRIDLVRLSRA